uniref:polya polymerase n=1 Tax=Agathobacter sp. TaxID=2021311 RepID=UPI004056A63D
MKVTDIGNVNRFFDAVDKCEGKVELVTEQGDCLNLGSKISQFVATVKIVTDTNIRQGDIVSYNQNDEEKLMKCIGII